MAGEKIQSQSLSGWDGVFHNSWTKETESPVVGVAIPFRVGWGFSLKPIRYPCGSVFKVAIPFRVGWGFSRGAGESDAGGSET